MNKHLVSICIPAYNSALYITDTIEAALKQDYDNLEVVVVDDKSSDNTIEVVKSIDDSRVHLYCNEHNLGMTGNWNRCIELASGEYIKLIPADDIVYPKCVSASAAILDEHENVSLVVVGTDLISTEGKIVGAYAHWAKEEIVKGGKIAKRSVMFNNFYGNPVCALFRKKDYMETGGFDADIPYILDFDLWLGLSNLGDVAVVKKHLSAFRVRNDSNTGVLVGSKGKEYTAEHVRLIDKHKRLGTYKMNRVERRMSIAWRSLRNHIIAVYIKFKA